MGVEVSTGKYILFTDDDVLVDHNWIAAFACAFTRWPDAVIFGGKATPLLQPPTPSWFTNAACHLSDLLAIRDFGKEAIPLSREKKIMPYGLNYALRAAEQKRFLYNPDLGVAPGRRMGGEESDVFVRLMKAGYTGWWVPDAKVKHVIPPARQTTEYVRHFYEAIGELEVYGKLRNKRPFLLFGVPPLLWIKLPVTYARLHLGRCLGLSHHVPFLTSHAYRAGLFKAWRSAPCPTNKS
jgi:GT2 family glycosyltransferase